MANAALSLPHDAPEQDSWVCFHGVTWEDYRRVLAMRGENSAPRITYLEGELAIMSPSRSHERIKSILGRLVESWCLHHDVRFTTLGSWTLENEEAERAVEPDECYQLGDGDEERPPELAIEVVWSHWRIDKIDVYRKLGVRELWIWRDGALTLRALRGEAYEPIERSEVLPEIDLDQLVGFLDRPTTYDAIRDYRAVLEG